MTVFQRKQKDYAYFAFLDPKSLGDNLNSLKNRTSSLTIVKYAIHF